jgi:putative ABC transport system ATP-binding protein
MARPVVDLRAITKVYGGADTVVRAVDGVDLVVERGDYLAVMGASGSGKSTLMNIIGCLDVPSSGRYLLDGVDTRRLDERRQALVRNRKIGFIFQSFNLIPRTTAVSNVELPMAYAGMRAGERRHRAIRALEQVGLGSRVHHLPSQLSGGQQQRVAIARAIATDPVLLLADEPTGALDSRSTEDVLALFDDLNVDGRTIIVITHEEEVAHHAKRVVRMRDGRIVADQRVAAATDLPPRWSGARPTAARPGLDATARATSTWATPSNATPGSASPNGATPNGATPTRAAPGDASPNGATPACARTGGASPTPDGSATNGGAPASRNGATSRAATSDCAILGDPTPAIGVPSDAAPISSRTAAERRAGR